MERAKYRIKLSLMWPYRLFKYSTAITTTTTTARRWTANQKEKRCKSLEQLKSPHKIRYRSCWSECWECGVWWAFSCVFSSFFFCAVDGRSFVCCVVHQQIYDALKFNVRLKHLHKQLLSIAHLNSKRVVYYSQKLKSQIDDKHEGFSHCLNLIFVFFFWLLTVQFLLAISWPRMN